MAPALRRAADHGAADDAAGEQKTAKSNARCDIVLVERLCRAALDDAVEQAEQDQEHLADQKPHDGKPQSALPVVECAADHERTGQIGGSFNDPHSAIFFLDDLTIVVEVVEDEPVVQIAR